MKQPRDVLAKCIKEVNNSYSYAARNLERYRQSVRFNLGHQWDDQTAADYDAKSKPRLTFNRLYAYIKTVIGEQLQNTPDLQVRSENLNTPQESVDLLSDMIRHISYASRAHEIYQHAFKCVLMGGFGAFRVITEYENDESFNQVIKLVKIKDPTHAYWDPDAEESTKCDGDYCGLTYRMPRGEFEKKYPKALGAESFPTQNYTDDSALIWSGQDYITLAEHYRKQYYTKNLVQMSDGQVVDADEVDEYMAQVRQAYNAAAKQAEETGQPIPQKPAKLKAMNKRSTRAFKIMHYVLTKNEVLEKTEWPSKYLPIIYVDGDSFIVDGKDTIHSYTAFAEDAQRFYNFTVSNIAECLKSSRKEQWIGTPQNITGNETMLNAWKTPELTQGILLANPDPQTGQLPTKVPPSEIPMTLLNTKPLLEEDIQSIIGRSDASQGQQGQELSGTALAARIMQSNAGSNEQFNNLQRAVEQAGRCILDLIPAIYDTERPITVQSKDGKKKVVTINAHGGLINPIEKGNYDVEVQVGANFAMQKAQALGQMLQLAQINPEVFPVIADLVAANVDLENTNEIVKRFETLLPPNIQAQKNGQPPPPPPPNPQAQMMQQQMQLEQAKLQLEQQQLGLKQQEMQLKAQMGQAQNQVQAMKLQSQALDLQQKNQGATIQAYAQTTKAQAEIASSRINALTTLAKAHSDIHKSNADVHKTNINLIGIGRGQPSADNANVRRN